VRGVVHGVVRVLAHERACVRRCASEDASCVCARHVCVWVPYAPHACVRAAHLCRRVCMVARVFCRLSLPCVCCPVALRPPGEPLKCRGRYVSAAEPDARAVRSAWGGNPWEKRRTAHQPHNSGVRACTSLVYLPRRLEAIRLEAQLDDLSHTTHGLVTVEHVGVVLKARPQRALHVYP